MVQGKGWDGGRKGGENKGGEACGGPGCISIVGEPPLRPPSTIVSLAHAVTAQVSLSLLKNSRALFVI